MANSFGDLLLHLVESQPYLQNKNYKASVKEDGYGCKVIFDEIWPDDLKALRVDLTKNGFSHVYVETLKLKKKEDERT